MFQRCVIGDWLATDFGDLSYPDIQGSLARPFALPCAGAVLSRIHFALVPDNRRRLGQSQGGGGDNNRDEPTATKLFCEVVDVVGPALERIPHVVGVFGALVNASHATAMARVVVENGLDVVGLDAEFA